MKTMNEKEQQEVAEQINKEIADFKEKVCGNRYGVGHLSATTSLEDRVTKAESAINELIYYVVLAFRGMNNREAYIAGKGDQAATLASRAHDCSQLAIEMMVNQFFEVAKALGDARQGVISTRSEAEEALAVAHQALVERAMAHAEKTGKPVRKAEYAELITESSLQSVAKTMRSNSNRSFPRRFRG